MHCIIWLQLLSIVDAWSLSSTNSYGDAPVGTIPLWLSSTNSTTPSKDAPWANVNPAGPPPDTGVTRYYNFVITRANQAPDGYVKNLILVNDQFPGPLIEANWGDIISVTVSNEIEPEHEEGTTLHWHGLTQVKTPWFDGVPGVSQCPISPGKSFTYSFQADQYGTSWYHSHYSGQYSDGLYGPMVIYGPLQPGVSYDYDLGPVMLSDYIHESYYAEMQKLFLIPPEFPNVDNNLINGIGQYDGNGNSHARFHVQSGKTYRLRLINTGGSANQKFSIDGISLTVIANDYVPVKPYTTDVVTLGIGQRTDVIFNASGSSTNLVWMRSEIDMDCLNLTATVSTAQAIIYYEDADPSATPSSTPYSWQSEQCANDPLSRTVPFYPQALPNNTYSQNVEITLGVNATGHVVFFVDGSSFRADYNYPVLLLTKQGNTSYPYSPDWNVYNFGANSSVRVVIRNTYGMQHPMHLHGQNFFVLAEGYGEWNGIVVNPANPQRRDTHILQPGSTSNASYVVLEWYQQNPGIWPLHCHTAIHVSAGLYLNVMALPELVEHDLEIPSVMAQTCRDWWSFTSHDFVDQIDSGV